ncbi:MAG TPA: PAS domain S-box protein [Chitinophagales bacterium]|nr:PAS domain S-box protein [Chitinophagales bacterium]
MENEPLLQLTLLQTILHTTPHFVGVVKNGLFIMVNEAGVKMFEMKNEEELFEYSPSLLKRNDSSGDQSLNGSQTSIREFVTGKGNTFYGEMKIEGFTHGKQKYYLVCISNVDQLERNRGESSREKQKFEALFDHATVGVVVARANGEITMINSLGEKLFGYSREKLIGEKVEKLIPMEYNSRHVKHRNSFVEDPAPRPMGADRNLFAQKSDGTKFPVEISLSSYKIDNELFVIAFVIDITIRKQNEDAIRNQRDELEKSAIEIRELNVQLEKRVEERTLALRETLRQLEMSREELRIALEKERELGDLKSRFVSMASHEFRTPLSTILSSAALIDRYVHGDEQVNRSKHVNRIKENVRNLTDILEDFLSLGKIEEGIVLPKPEQLNIPAFFNEIIHDLDSLKKSSQNISYVHEGDAIFTIDKHLLKNILINLLTNAIKFSNDDGSIVVNSLLKKGQFRFSVKDQGIGISKEDKEHLFDRFFRGRNAANIKGTGLGLHIVSKYLELLNGKIDCKSKLNQGTEFIITFNTANHEIDSID